MKLGAHEFVAAKDNPKLEGVKPIDYLVVTTSAQPDWDVYFNVMAPGGKVSKAASSAGLSFTYSLF